jgi:hypothetical protein
MTGATSPAFPGSRKLAGWWRQLAPYQPQALWVGHFLLHHVEALVRVSQACRPDPFTLFLLRALALSVSDFTADATGAAQILEYLDEHLHLGRQVLHQALRGLETDGLAQSCPSGRWTITGLGRDALERHEYPRAAHERRSFYFIESAEPNGPDRPPPHYVNVHYATGISWAVADDTHFDVGTLESCLRQPVEWKQQHGFPVNVQEVVRAGSARPPGALAPPAWQSVIVDRPERIAAALVLTAAGALVGLAIRPDGWTLQAGSPLFAIQAHWSTVFPNLPPELPPAMWRLVWRSWCESRGLPGDEAEACVVEQHGERLRVIAPPRLIERLRATRSDVFKGETLLLAGEGKVRTGAVVHLVEAA